MDINATVILYNLDNKLINGIVRGEHLLGLLYLAIHYFVENLCIIKTGALTM
jgi:hypothetical protein